MCLIVSIPELSLDWLTNLVIDGDRADDHLLGVLPLHVVEAQRVDIGGQVTAHLIRPTGKQ
jgi:hypothetical protein